MSVDRKKILLGSIGSGATLNIPLTLDFFPVDNAELIQDKFVDDAKEKSINEIIDYKKIIFKPTNNSGTLFDQFKIRLNFYTPFTITNGNPQYRDYLNGANVAGVYSDIGFVFDDLFCRTDRFMNSFLRLSFFDNPHSGDNSLLFYSDIYTQVGDDQEDEYGLVLPDNECPVSFLVGDPVKKPDLVHESFYIYWFKDLVDNATGGEYTLWMSAIYNNAANGKQYGLTTSKIINYKSVELGDLEGENGILYLKVVLFVDDGVYKYRFEGNTKQLPTQGGEDTNPSTGIPTLTFYQITP